MSTNRIYCGIDPGKHGAIALYDPLKDWLNVGDVPLLRAGANGKEIVDVRELASMLKTLTPRDIVIIEHVSAMPGQGVTSMFSFGETFGMLQGIVATLGVPYTLVRPQAWKKALGLGKEKDSARLKASQLLPAHSSNWNRKIDHGRAEAALLAYYLSRTS